MLQYIQGGWQAIVDGQAGLIAAAGMSSVFIALSVLAVFMAALGRLFQARDADQLPATLHRLLGGVPRVAPQLAVAAEDPAPPRVDEAAGIPASVLAAIAAAISLDLEATSRTPVRTGSPITSWRQAARRLTPRPKR